MDDDAVFDGAFLQGFVRSLDSDGVYSVVHKPLDGMALSASDIYQVAGFEIINKILPYHRIKGIGISSLDKPS